VAVVDEVRAGEVASLFEFGHRGDLSRRAQFSSASARA
jgi:hypothetical protein